MAAASSSRVGGSAPQVNPTARNTVIATKLDATHRLWIIARLQPNSTADDGRLPPLNSGRHSHVRVAGSHCAASDLGATLPASRPQPRCLMRLIGLAVILTFSLILAPLAAEAQLAGRVPRIGIVSTFSLEHPQARELSDAFRQGPRELGYVEGRNIVIEYRSAQGRVERVPDAFADLVS